MSLSYLEFTMLSDIKKQVIGMDAKQETLANISNSLRDLTSAMTGLVDSIHQVHEQIDRTGKGIEEQIFKLVQATWAGKE